MTRLFIALAAASIIGIAIYASSGEAAAEPESEAVCTVAPMGATPKKFAEGVATTINNHRAAGRDAGMMNVSWGYGDMSPTVVCAW
jgi:hypothetical protein